jgi:hypothetical protein
MLIPPPPFIGHGFTFLSMSTLSYFPEFRFVQPQLPIASRLKTKALVELTAKYLELHSHDLCMYTGPKTQLRFGGEARLDGSAYLGRL